MAQDAGDHGHTTERRGFGSLRLRGKIWYVRYRVDGKEHWESTGSTSRRKAEEFAATIKAERGLGVHTSPAARRVGFAELERMLRDYYLAHGLRSLDRAEDALTHLRAAFDTTRATAITEARITGYEADRLRAGAARATVNYELATLRKMFREAVRLRRLSRRPDITIRKAENARTGFFEPDDFAALLAALPAYLRPVMQFAYNTGWRVRSEVLPLTWDRVDFAVGVVRLDPHTTKSGEGRVFPFNVLPALAAVLRAQRTATTALEKATGQIVPYVFHNRGRPIRNYYHAWKLACTRAAKSSTTVSETLAIVVRPQLLGRLVHDFRRTAVRNLVRAGVQEKIAMELCGHRTREVFDRYNISNEADLRAGVAKLATFHAGTTGATGTTGTTGTAAPEPARGSEGEHSGLRLVSGAE
jgi:site-specific recombinase XerD